LQLTINRRQEETDMHITTVGLDLAKNLFHLVGLDAQGREVMKKRLSRAQVLRHFANLPKCLIGMEASAGGPLLRAGTLRAVGVHYAYPELQERHTTSCLILFPRREAD
jgi:hypothetical protein